MKFTQEHDEIRRSISKFIASDINPFVDEWEKAEIFPAKELFRKMGKLGFLGVNKPVEYGGQGPDYSYAAAFAQGFFAGGSQANGQPDAAYQIAAAKVTSAGAALANARSGIQIHGGTGFTAECDAHVFLKRAHLLGQLGGERHWIRETLLTQALDDRVSLS